MHTDEYLISLSREVSLCRRVCKQLEKALQKREKRYELTTEAFLALPEQNWPPERIKDYQRWGKDHRQLQSWREKLGAYEKIYLGFKGK